MKEKTAIFIDGSNLYFKLRAPENNIKQLSKFNYRGLAEWLAQNREIVHIGYYVGVVRVKDSTEKNQSLRKEQQKLFAHLSSAEQKIIVCRGYILGNNGVYHEKGVDVQLAVDLLVGAYENKYDTAIIISSDTDLLPAIKKIKNLNKKVIYVGFSCQPSFAMQKNADFSRLLIKEELTPFEFSYKNE